MTVTAWDRIGSFLSRAKDLAGVVICIFGQLVVSSSAINQLLFNESFFATDKLSKINTRANSNHYSPNLKAQHNHFYYPLSLSFPSFPFLTMTNSLATTREEAQ
mmetsp:Transcript_29714/g.36185  ORF Transcript_29714/g.36185 Transcript_29714/m.36185 type:complete len:104 (+) Transcript_29714:335-646(+)